MQQISGKNVGATKKCPLLDEAHSQKKFVPKIYSCPHESVFLITILIQKIMSMSLFNPPPQPENKTTRYGNRTGLGSLPSKQNDH